MYTLIITFYVSIIGIILMIFLKRREVKTGKQALFARMGTGADHVFQTVFSAIGTGISYINKHTVIACTQWLAFHVLFRIRTIYVELKHRALINPHSRKVIDAVRGRAELGKAGPSLYLRRISSGQ